MISVSLCMIVKNEEDVLERCLKSLAGLVDEIIYHHGAMPGEKKSE